MASLNLSTNGPSIKSSYQGVINGPALSSASPTAARWALFTVQAPLQNAFQNTGAKESVLRVESTGGECDDNGHDGQPRSSGTPAVGTAIFRSQADSLPLQMVSFQNSLKSSARAASSLHSRG